MKKIATLIDRESKWIQPSALKQEYELRVGDELAATLNFPSSFRSHATGQSADGSWDFQREGPFHTRILIRPSGASQELASFKKSAWKSCGVLEMTDGRTFKTASNIWGSRYSFLDASGEPIIELKNCGVLHRAANLTIARGAANMPELPMMALLAWYLDVMMMNDAAGVAAIAAAG